MDIELFPETLGTEAFLLACSFVLSGIIGLERELRQKSAGARTHILVGMGSALFTLVSAYGFQHVLGDDVVIDPSRIAAQIVTGIGFLGAGVIFVRRNIISGSRPPLPCGSPPLSGWPAEPACPLSPR